MGQIKPILKIIKDGRQITLKSLQAGDGAEILEVERRIFAECGQFTLTTLEEFTYTAEHEEEMIQRHLEHPTKVTIVPVMDGKLIGMLNFSCGARNRNSHHGVFGVSVLPEYQGQGIGRMMVEALL